MCLRKRYNQTNGLLSLGLLCFSIGGALKALFASRAPIPEALVDFLFGVGIGIMVFGLWRKRRCQPTD